MKKELAVTQEHEPNLKMLRPQTQKPLPPTNYDIDFHGMKFLFRVEGHPCGFILKYVHMVPIESMLPPEIREFAKQTGAMQIVDKDKVMPKPVLERHVHVRWWERPFKGYVQWKVAYKARQMHKLWKDHLYFDEEALAFQQSVSQFPNS